MNIAISATRRAMKEMADGTIRVQLDIDPQFRAAFLSNFNEIDMPVAIVPLAMGFESTSQETDKTNHSEASAAWASELYKAGWWNNPMVLAAFGSDQNFLDWLKTQPCCADKNSRCDGDVVAAHVRRIANGAGTGIKPPYSAVPLCNWHHQQQHQHGESVVGGKDYLDRQLLLHRAEWIKGRLYKWFGVTSLRDIPAVAFIAYCESIGIRETLPHKVTRDDI